MRPVPGNERAKDEMLASGPWSPSGTRWLHREFFAMTASEQKYGNSSCLSIRSAHSVRNCDCCAQSGKTSMLALEQFSFAVTVPFSYCNWWLDGTMAVTLIDHGGGRTCRVLRGRY